MKTKQLLQKYSWPLVVFAINRLGLFILVYFSLILLPLNPDIDVWHTFPDNLFLDGWARWDSGWYVHIATQGYSDKPNEQGQKNVVFFPLYPLFIRILNFVTHDSYISGMLISNLAFAVSLILLYRLVCEQHDEVTGRWAVVLLATYPFSFYFSAVYTEALFLLTVVGAFYFGEQKRWVLAAVMAALASATRGIGLTITLGLLVLYIHKINFTVRKIGLDIIWILLGVTGLISYMLFLYYKFDAPILFVTARQVSGWEQHVSVAWQTILDSLYLDSVLTGSYPALNILHIIITLTALLIATLTWRKIGLAQSVWTISYLLISFITAWHGMGRYIAPVFPLFIGVVLLVNKNYWLLLAIVYLNTLFLALFTIMYTHFYWVS